MDLEEHKVLLRQRWNLFQHLGKKEWWYTGVHDPQHNTYLGFSLIRTTWIDAFHVAFFSPTHNELTEINWKGYIHPDNPANQLCLKIDHKNLTLDYRGSAALGWNCHIRAKEFAADLRIRPRQPAFTKYDNMFDHEYTLLHFFGNTVEGFVQAKGREHRFHKALGYYDHCFGKVPTRSRWHWIAVQSQEFALASLVNYGPTAQCYTQCYSRSAAPREVCDRWIRLDQDVSFECDPEQKWSQPWRITSPEMDLELHILQRSRTQERIPPGIPILLSIDHEQCYVKVRGKVRLDGRWQHTGDLYGVLEEHHGHW